MRWRLVLVFSVVLCLGVAGAPAGAHAKFLKAMWGPTEVPASNAICRGLGRSCSVFPVYKKLGVDVFQFQIHWDDVAPTQPLHARDPADPAYRWGEVDSIVAEAQRNGVGLAPMLIRSPSWANGERPPIWAPYPLDFANFAYAASKRYPGIRRWMIWGEPSRKEDFRPVNPRRRGPRLYAQILDSAYASLKRANPKNIVIGGMTFPGGIEYMPTEYLRWMKLRNGRPPRVDLWGHNAFDLRYPRLRDPPVEPGVRGFNDIDTFHSEIRAVYRSGRRKVPKLWISEWNPDPFVFSTNPQQAGRLKAAYAIARRTKYVAALGWFTLLDGGYHWGLMDANGNPKPSFYAYKALP